MKSSPYLKALDSKFSKIQTLIITILTNKFKTIENRIKYIFRAEKLQQKYMKSN